MSLKQLAIDTLAKNDRGGFTIPTAGLYPYQWNWDSAWSEITTLIDGQWPDGMIPSIIFRSDELSYFPRSIPLGQNPRRDPVNRRVATTCSGNCRAPNHPRRTRPVASRRGV